jgi:hypothetical protein
MSYSDYEYESEHDLEDPTSEASTKKRKKWPRGLMTLQKGANQWR